MKDYIRRRPGRGRHLTFHDFDHVSRSHYIRLTTSSLAMHISKHAEPTHSALPMSEEEVWLALKTLGIAADKVALKQCETRWEASLIKDNNHEHN